MLGSEQLTRWGSISSLLASKRLSKLAAVCAQPPGGLSTGLYRTLTSAAPPRSEPSLPDLPLLQGRPKGVEISHGGLRDLIAFFVEKMELGAMLCLSVGGQSTRLPGPRTVAEQPAWMHTPASLQPANPLHAGPDDVFCLNTTVCFDPYVLYLYGCLVVGGCLVIPKPEGHVGE